MSLLINGVIMWLLLSSQIGAADETAEHHAHPAVVPPQIASVVLLSRAGEVLQAGEMPLPHSGWSIVLCRNPETGEPTKGLVLAAVATTVEELDAALGQIDPAFAGLGWQLFEFAQGTLLSWQSEPWAEASVTVGGLRYTGILEPRK